MITASPDQESKYKVEDEKQYQSQSPILQTQLEYTGVTVAILYNS